MAGPSISPTSINLNGKFIFTSSFGFSGGGTQTVLTIAVGEVWILYSCPVNYGGSDYRHGSIFYATRATNGQQVRGSLLGAAQTNSTFALAGNNSVSYNAGGGAPNNTIFLLRLK